MGLIRLENVSKQFGGQIVLDDISLELSTGEIVGLVGANGSGKTTLFRLIAGRMTPDMGSISVSRGTDLGYLAQEPEVNLENTMHDEALSAFAHIVQLEHKLESLSHDMSAAHDAGDEQGYRRLVQVYERTQSEFDTAGGYGVEQRIYEILAGLGFSEADYKLPMSALSGGQKCRVALAKLLAQDASFLLLDEPTNHLDIDAVRWLEKFLANHHGGAIIISHDRYLLDRVVTRIVEVDRTRVRSYIGNYTTYHNTRSVDFLTAQRQYEKDQDFIAKEKDFIARHLAGQRSQEAKGRRTRLQRAIADGELMTAAPTERKTVKLAFKPTIAYAGEIIVGTGLSKRYEDKQLFHDMSFRVSGGTRVGITGPNGTGKSTLLKIVLGLVKADAGDVAVTPKVSIGYYAQESRDLDPARTILQEIRECRPDLDDERARAILGGFLFIGDDVFKKLGTLSGGEQSRVRLLKLILTTPNVLMLDEPTNHLDIPSREALEEALQEFPGTIIAVSHDRYFLDRIANRLFVMRREGTKFYNGNYSYYIEQLEAQQRAKDTAAKKPESRVGKSRPEEPGGEKRSGRDLPTPSSAGNPAKPAAPKPPKKKDPFDKLSMTELEKYIAERDAKLVAITEKFGDPTLARDFGVLEKMQAEFDLVKKERDAAEAAWMSRADE